MISYELAKQLRGAGFPQIASRRYFYRWDDMKESNSPFSSNPATMSLYKTLEEKDKNGRYKFTDLKVACPTLEELIDACQGCFMSLETDTKLGWVAKSQELINKEDNRVYLMVGKTPDEVVAKLYLALYHKK